jgi:hypothetical protein
MSIYYCNVADMRNFKGNNSLKHKILENLMRRWGEMGIRNINPPFVESIANFFGSKSMKIHYCEEKNRKNGTKSTEKLYLFKICNSF